jgi:hypothetical protein
MNQWILKLACLLLAFACAAAYGSAQNVHRIEIDPDRIGSPPENFELLRTGTGDLGRWTVVADMTSVAGVAIEQLSEDQTENRFSLAVYKPLQVKNLALRVRIKLLNGAMQTAGLAFRIQDSDNYYVVPANAFEKRVDLFRIVNGKMERIAGIDAEIFINRWHTLAVIAKDERFAIAVDNEPFFAASDRTLLLQGRIGLWAEEDNLSRFEEVALATLPAMDER